MDDNLPTITAGFTHTINPYTGTVTFINTSSDVKYYLWTLGTERPLKILTHKTYVNGTYKVVLVRNSAGASDTWDTIVIGIIAPPDVVAPVITLIGNPLNVVVGAFTDQGVTASDNVDGTLQAGL
jgi:hypothetical protein